MYTKIDIKNNPSKVITNEGRTNNGTLNLADNRPQVIVQNRLMGIIQQKKTEKERGDKSKRLAHATNLIPQIAAIFKPQLATHIFGGEFNDGSPKGLHAYRNGSLSNNVHDKQNVQVIGNKNKVHEIRWTHIADTANPKTPKNSTMFPQWMPENHVKTLIGLRYADTLTNDFNTYHGESLKTYILHGLEINIQKAGDTVYPTL